MVTEHPVIMTVPSNMGFKRARPLFSKIHNLLVNVGGGIVQWNKSLIRPGGLRGGRAALFVTGRVGYAWTRTIAVVWLRKCPGLSVGQQPQAAKVPEVTLATDTVLHGARRSLNVQQVDATSSFKA